VTHCHCCKEDSSPAAQMHWRRNVRGNGISPTEQQVAAGNQIQSRHYCVKHHIEYISLELLLVHNQITHAKVHNKKKIRAIREQLFAEISK
jgi:hypothetical protein